MSLDPATVCARTHAGEQELAKPSRGLALGQRRVLSLLGDPCAFEELVARHALDDERLTRDLDKLASAGLVSLHAPQSAARVGTAMGVASGPGRSAGTGPVMVLVVIGVTLVAIAWFVAR